MYCDTRRNYTTTVGTITLNNLLRDLQRTGLLQALDQLFGFMADVTLWVISDRV